MEVTKEIRYEDYEKLIMKKAHLLARRYRVPNLLEDLLEEGQICFCKALQSFDPAMGAFSSYLWKTLDWLQTFIRRSMETSLTEISLLPSLSEKSRSEDIPEVMDTLADSRWDPQQFSSYLEEAREQLSGEYLAMFEFGVASSPEDIRASGKSRCRYMVEEFSRVSGVSKFRCRILWKELRQWWRVRIYKEV